MYGVNISTPNQFSGEQRPAHYVPGAGRGAVGFRTGADLPGQSQYQPPRVDFGQAPAGYVAGRGRGAGSFADSRAAAGAAAEQAGGGAAARAVAPGDGDDADADAIYAAVDEAMARRRKRTRDTAAPVAGDPGATKRAQLGAMFSDAKAALASVSVAEWDAIPDIGDRSLAYKKPEYDRITPAPDSLLASAAAATTAGAPAGTAAFAPGTSGAATSVKGLQEAKGALLRGQLDKAGDAVAGGTTVDTSGYLTSLATTAPTAGVHVDDIRRTRELMTSMTASNPHHPLNWIAAARFEESANAIDQARKVILRGCELCPKSEDVWLEAVRLAQQKVKGVLLANAVKCCPTSVALWMKAADQELEFPAKKAVLRRALEFVPSSVQLWKAAVALEEPEDAALLLDRAVKCVPKSVELWLALAKLQPYAQAKAVLNSARKALPTEPRIWVAAAQLEEEARQIDNVEKIIAKAYKSLAGKAVIVDRATWFELAQEAEAAADVHTAAALVKPALVMGVEKQDRQEQWLNDAADFERAGYIGCARATLAYLAQLFPGEEAVWRSAVALEQRAGSSTETIQELLAQAVRSCPSSEHLWLQAAQLHRAAGNLDQARELLAEAYRRRQASEQVILAAAKLEWDAGQREQALRLLDKARETINRPRVWWKQAVLLQQMPDLPAAATLLDAGVQKFSASWRLWLMRLQVLEQLDTPPAERRTVCAAALRACPTCPELWLVAAALDEQIAGIPKARATLDAGKRKLPQSDQLWCASVELEHRAGQPEQAKTILARALQECPSSGRVWAVRIQHSARSERKRVCEEAMKRADKDGRAWIAVARLFWRDHAVDRARRWFSHAAAQAPDNGDVWVQWCAFERAEGNSEQALQVAAQAAAVAPRHGDAWPAVAKLPELRMAPFAEKFDAAVAQVSPPA